MRSPPWSGPGSRSPTDPTPRPPPRAVDAPIASSAEQSVADGWTVINYAVSAGDAIVIRLSGDALASCDFKIHGGPRRGVEHIRLGIAVDYLIVPAGEAKFTVSKLARACGEYWTTTD